jgi:hypothetical protein
LYRIALSVGCLPQLLSSDPSPAFCSAKVSGFRKWQVTAMRLYCMENNDEEVSSRHFPFVKLGLLLAIQTLICRKKAQNSDGE